MFCNVPGVTFELKMLYCRRMTNAVQHTDEDILVRFRGGEESAYRHFFERHYGAILYYALHILERRSDAEDVVQEVFYKLWQHRTDFNSAEHIKSFLYKSTRFACINQLRSGQSRELQAEVLLQRALNDSFADSRLVEEELFRAVIAEISGLPEKYGTILSLRYLHDLDYHEIAKKLGISEATVRKQKQRAMELLRTVVLKKKLLVADGLVFLLERIHL